MPSWGAVGTAVGESNMRHEGKGVVIGFKRATLSIHFLGLETGCRPSSYVRLKFRAGVRPRSAGRRVGRVAARLGLEPRQNESESFVLPLHHRAEKPFILHVRVLAGSRDPAAPEDAARSKSETGGWSRRWDSNPQPPVYKTGALPLSYAGRTCRHRGRKFEFKQHQARATLRRPAGVGPVDAGWWLPGDSNPEPTD